MGLRTLNDLLSGPPLANPRLFTAWDGAAWRTTSGEELRERVTRLGAALLSYGFTAGSRAAVLAPPGPEALTAMLAFVGCGGVAVPLDPRLADDRIRLALEATECRVAIAFDSDQLRRLVALRADLPELDMVLVFHPPRTDRPSAALTVESAWREGEQALAGDPDVMDRIARRIEKEDPAWIPPRADGTVAMPPLVRTHAESVAPFDSVAGTCGLGASDVALVALPATDAAWLERVGACLAIGASVVFGRGENSTGDDLRELRPTVAMMRPAALDSHIESVLGDIGGRSWVRRRIAAWSLRQGRNPSRRPWVHRLAGRMTLQQLRDDLGGRLRAVETVGGAPREGTLDFLQALGVGRVGSPRPGTSD